MDIHSAHIEMRPNEYALLNNETWIIGWSICNINDIEKIKHGNSVESFINYIKKLNSTKIYLYSLKIQGFPILEHLIRNGYIYCKKLKDMKNNNYSCLISEDFTIYSITIKSNQGKYIEFRDISKKVNEMSIQNIQEKFNTKYKLLEPKINEDIYPGSILKEKLLEYICNFSRIIAEVIKYFYERKMDKLTIGADSFKIMIDLYGGRKEFNHYFPKIDIKEDQFIRKSFRGGWCYLNPKYERKLIKDKIFVYDVNSLYPFMMTSNKYKINDVEYENVYPFKHGVYFKGEYEYDKNMPIYIIHKRLWIKLKKGYLPTIYRGMKYLEQDRYITDSKGEIDLYLTSIDYELMLEHYDIITEDPMITEGYKYNAHKGFFDKFVSQENKLKEESIGGKREISKLIMNNGYGKFVQKDEFQVSIPYFEDNEIKFNIFKGEGGSRIYSPVGIFVTAYARRYTIKNAQLNYDNFVYSDTDSIHIIGNSIKESEIDDKKIGKWKLEKTSNESFYLRQKSYLLKNDKGYDVTCAGMTDYAKQELINDLINNRKQINDFDYNSIISYNNKKYKRVKGGYVLDFIEFKLNE